MNVRPTLLVVDDEVMNQNIILDLLEDEYEVDFACNGRECLNSLEQKTPDLILLDVNMPILNGLETCKHIRNKSKFKRLPIIFISALASVQERLAGYQAGGDDYLTKPFEEDELKAKISLLLKAEDEKNKTKEDIRNAMGTARTAMTNNGELNTVFNLMKSLLTENNLNTILASIKDALANLNLEGCVMLAHTNPPVYFFTDNKLRPIEQDVMREMHLGGKVIEFSNSALFNTKHAALLIRELPENEDMKKRYKDHLCIIIDTLEEKLKQRVNDFKIERHFQRIKDTVKSVSLRLQKASELSHHHNREQNVSILKDLSEQIEDTFLDLNLDNPTKTQLKNLILTTEKKFDDVSNEDKQTILIFEGIINDLSNLQKRPISL